MRPTIASEIWKQINNCEFGQKVMPVFNFLLLYYCAVDKDIVPGDIMKLRVYTYVGQLGDQITPNATDKLFEHA